MSQQEEQTVIPEEFHKIMEEFIIAFLEVNPEYEENLNVHVMQIQQKTAHPENIRFLYEYCQSVYPTSIFHIMGKNGDIFNDPETNTFFLPEIDFKEVWNNSEITDSTRETIWKYLQLVLFTIVGNVSDMNSFGDTAKLFEMIDEEELKDKLQETFQNMEQMFSESMGENEESGEQDQENGEKQSRSFNMPDVNNIHDHLKGLMEGKLGRLAVEIAEETAEELNLNDEDHGSVQDVFTSMMKNPGKLMGIANKIGSKLETKMKSGELNERELMKEASEMFNKMKNTPGMGDFEKILKSMSGMGKKGKLNMNAMQAQVDRNLKMASMRERAMKKAAEKKEKMRQEEERRKEMANMPDTVDVEKLIQELEAMDEKKFSAGEKPEKSARPKKKKKKGKK